MFIHAWFALLSGLFFANAAPPPASNAAIFLRSSSPFDVIKHIYANITLDSVTTNLMSISFDMHNPLPMPLTIRLIISRLSLNGTTYATVAHDFKPNFVIPAYRTANSGEIPGVILTQGAKAILGIVADGILDTDSDIGARAFILPLNVQGDKQSSVPTSYNLVLS